MGSIPKIWNSYEYFTRVKGQIEAQFVQEQNERLQFQAVRLLCGPRHKRYWEIKNCKKTKYYDNSIIKIYTKNLALDGNLNLTVRNQID